MWVTSYVDGDATFRTEHLTRFQKRTGRPAPVDHPGVVAHFQRVLHRGGVIAIPGERITWVWQAQEASVITYGADGEPEHEIVYVAQIEDHWHVGEVMIHPEPAYVTEHLRPRLQRAQEAEARHANPTAIPHPA